MPPVPTPTHPHKPKTVEVVTNNGTTIRGSPDYIVPVNAITVANGRIPLVWNETLTDILVQVWQLSLLFPNHHVSHTRIVRINSGRLKQQRNQTDVRLWSRPTTNPNLTWGPYFIQTQYVLIYKLPVIRL